MRKTSVFILALLIVVIILNISVPTKQGVNYKVAVYRIPLYIKIIEFIDRDYRYRNLSHDIISGIKEDREKALKILEWVRSNIKSDMPKDWPVYDDHILNIIIRGYGVSDQLNDVFTTLCMYSGLPAGWARIIAPGSSKALVLSFVMIDGKWCIFDVSRGIYFIGDDGGVANLEEISSRRYKDSSRKIEGFDLAYKDYIDNVGPYIKDITLRVKKQMPFYRIIYETSFALGLKGRQ